MGLDWMLRPANRTEKGPAAVVDLQQEEPPAEGVSCYSLSLSLCLSLFLNFYLQLID